MGMSSKRKGDLKMKKYVVVGTGSRGYQSYINPLVKKYTDVATLCGVYDINYKRAELMSELTETDIPVYYDFDEMLEKVKPDTVIVTTKDSAHDHYVIKALNFGCDVICEKPLTTTFEKALAIKEARDKTGKDVTVTFNLRFNPILKALKEYVKSGIVGDVLSVHFQWMLNTVHGADYFRRWHAQKENSGSLMVHKSTHHFDLINWFLEQDPVTVNAFGTRRFYGEGAHEPHGEKCRTCQYKDSCEYPMVEDAMLDKLYYNCEDVDGYLRDKCIYSPDIDIEDTVSVNVKYSGGTVMSYSLTAHSPIEGYNIILNGSKGRLEFTNITTPDKNYVTINQPPVFKVYTRDGQVLEPELPKPEQTGHGGADDRLRDNLFRGYESDELGQMADVESGMMSIGIGMAANVSMAEGRSVNLSEFYGDLKKYAK